MTGGGRANTLLLTVCPSSSSSSPRRLPGQCGWRTQQDYCFSSPASPPPPSVDLSVSLPEKSQNPEIIVSGVAPPNQDIYDSVSESKCRLVPRSILPPCLHWSPWWRLVSVFHKERSPLCLPCRWSPGPGRVWAILIFWCSAAQPDGQSWRMAVNASAGTRWVAQLWLGPAASSFTLCHKAQGDMTNDMDCIPDSCSMRFPMIMLPPPHLSPHAHTHTRGTEINCAD